MASFRPRLQISSMILSKENSRNSVLLNVPSLTNFAVKDNARSFWLFKSKPAVEAAPPPPSPVEPSRGCPSRCLEHGYGKPVKKPRKRRSCGSKEPLEIKEKPSNCVKETPVEEKLSWWEQIVGPDPKKSLPDCICPLAYRQKRKARAQDPRLSDGRYKDTAGDVFLYTEQVKQCRVPCWEPQPKPPPAYKLPKALLCKMMSQDCEKGGTLNEQTDEDCQHLFQMASYRIPYEELRPPERRRKPLFSCREGIRPEDVLRPFSSDLSSCRIGSTAQPLRSCSLSYECPEKTATRVSKVKSGVELRVEKRSRIEQLKMLVQQKDTFHCISSSSCTN